MNKVPVIVVMGPAGCGKTTVAKSISAQYDYTFIEGDDFHSPESITQMTNGIPLNEFCRSVWLDRIVKTIVMTAACQETLGITVACSALRKCHRIALKRAEASQKIIMFFIFLKLDPETLLKRISTREGHFMKEEMLDSQLKTLEPPEADEGNVIVIDASGTPHEVSQLVFYQWERLVNKNID